MTLMLSRSASPARIKALRVIQAELAARAEAERHLEEVRRDADAVRDRCKTLRGFVKEAWHISEPTTPYIESWHQDAACEHLEAITRGEIQRLQINQPPGTNKSMNVSVMWQPFEWGPAGLPGLRYLTTSYTATYARRDSRKSRDLIQSEWYRTLWPEVVLTRDNETDFENTHRGVRKAMPFRSLTAGRGNRLICLPANQRIMTDRGDLPIGDIVGKRLRVKIAGFDGSTVRWQSIESYECNPPGDLVEIATDYGFVRCTIEHPVYIVGRGWIRADSIRDGETALSLARDINLQDLCEADQASCDNLPRDDAWNTGSTPGVVNAIVRSVKVIGDSGEPTFNLKVSPDHCYFAEGLLLHNCDDPHSTETVESDADRERARRIFRESVTSRLNDPKRDAILLIMHRLHPDDLCGLIEELGLPYVKLILPMEYVRSTTISTKWFTDPRTQDGELLCPARIPRETVEGNKIELGAHAYDTQYQQMARAREGSYFFTKENILDDQGLPVPTPARCDAVYAIVDTAIKEGKKRDGTGVAYYALINYPEPHLVILDWDIQQINANLLEVWLPNVFQRLEDLAAECHARMGSLGVWIEDKGSGTILLQQAENKEWNTHALDGDIVAAGKEGRAISVSGYVYKGLVKISAPAFDKVTTYKGRTRNHFLWQFLGFQVGKGVSDDSDDLWDAACYGIAVGLGNPDGI